MAELTQHIPNQGEHLVRYYGFYANKASGLRAKQAAVDQTKSDARQGNVIRKILEHCDLWQDPPCRAPPRPTRSSRSVRSCPEPDFASGVTYEVDHDFLEHAHREDLDQPELPWDP